MSDPEVPQPEQPADVDDVVDSAKAGLDEAAAAGAAVPEPTRADAAAARRADEAATTDAADEAPAEPVVDPDLAAFEAAERDFPGTFPATDADDAAGLRTDDRTEPAADASAHSDAQTVAAEAVADQDTPTVAAETVAAASIADSAYVGRDVEPDAETRVVSSEPIIAAAAPQPIFVQAPEPPRERGNRGTAGAIGLLAAVAFAVLYLGISLALGAFAGDVTVENIGEAALAPLTTVGFWMPVVFFFLGFWFLGAIINRGRWAHWVIWGLLVGVVAYGGYLLGRLFEAPFWLITASEGRDLVVDSLSAPLAIAAFVLGRELTIWFGAWVARSGARKTEWNAEAQREYERTLEAGPTLNR